MYLPRPWRDITCLKVRRVMSESTSHVCSGSKAGSVLRLIDFVCHSTLGLRVTKKKKSDLFESEAGDVGIGVGDPIELRMAWHPRQRNHLPGLGTSSR